MKTLLSILILLTLSFGLDTLTNKDLNFSIVFPYKPDSSIQTHKDHLGEWTNINYNYFEKRLNRYTSIIIKDYRKYLNNSLAGAGAVNDMANSMLGAIQPESIYELTLSKGEYREGYSFTNDKSQSRIYIYWYKKILYVLMIDEPHTVGVSLLDEFPGSFKFLK